MEEINEYQRKFILKIFNLDHTGSGKLILKEKFQTDYYPEDHDFVDYTFRFLEDVGFIKTPKGSHSFFLTQEGFRYCKQYFI